MRQLYARQTSVPLDLVVCASLYQGLAAKRVVTQLCGLQQCGSQQFDVPVVTPPITPPYFIIIYDGGTLLPTVYPLTLEGQSANWTVVYPAGRSHWFLSRSVHRSPC